MFETIFSWNTLKVFLYIIYIPSCLGLIGIVLLQKGKNMGFAGAFGVNPGGDTVLGPRASRSLPVRMTYFMAGAFMTICVLFALIEGRASEGVAPERVDPAEAAAMQLITDELDAAGVAAADLETEQPAQGDLESAPVDDASSTEPDSAAGDITEALEEDGVAAEIESMPGEDTP
jgi:protein translocase SecG subunit